MNGYDDVACGCGLRSTDIARDSGPGPRGVSCARGGLSSARAAPGGSEALRGRSPRGRPTAVSFGVAHPEGGNPHPFGDQEAIGCDAKRGMMVEAAPAAALEVPEPEF